MVIHYDTCLVAFYLFLLFIYIFKSVVGFGKLNDGVAMTSEF